MDKKATSKKRTPKPAPAVKVSSFDFIGLDSILSGAKPKGVTSYSGYGYGGRQGNGAMKGGKIFRTGPDVIVFNTFSGNFVFSIARMEKMLEMAKEMNTVDSIPQTDADY